LAKAVESTGDRARARELNLRALALADRIGHVAAVCEALEALAHLAAADDDFGATLRLIEAAELERTVHELPARARDREALEQLRRSAQSRLAPTQGDEISIDQVSTADVIATLLRSR
jgi:hypothetical protein